MSLETPNTEVRAMLRAQDELYRMLGMSLPNSRARRRHSIIGSPGHSEIKSRLSTSSLQSPTASRLLRIESSDSVLASYRVSRVDGRSQSYPVSLLDAYNMQDTDVGSLFDTLPVPDFNSDNPRLHSKILYLLPWIYYRKTNIRLFE